MQNVETDIKEKEERRRCWYFEETGEVREPLNTFEITEWVTAGGCPVSVCELHHPHKAYPILKLTEFSSNPLEPIKEVALLAKEVITGLEGVQVHGDKTPKFMHDLYELSQAISECMKRMEGKWKERDLKKNTYPLIEFVENFGEGWIVKNGIIGRGSKEEV